MSEQPIYYFDNNATTRLAPEVLEAMLPFLTEHWGNPSSGYRFGSEVAKHMEQARVKVAALIHADPREIIFTSCGTESNNAALHSALRLHPAKRHLLTTAVEHSANLKFAEQMAKQGFEVTLLPVESDGTLDLHRLESAIRADTALVSVMWANNETGVLFPVDEIAAICRSKAVPFHSDAVQAAGKLPIDVHAVGLDYLSLSAHKLHAPKGIGLLYVKRHAKFQPYLLGGGQERNRRGGTENVANIIAFGRAAELSLDQLTLENTVVRQLRDQLESGLLSKIAGVSVNGTREARLPNTTNLAFDSVEAEALLIRLDQLGICASSGSACTTGSLEPSHVLKAMGLAVPRARGSIRFSLGRYNRVDEVDYVLTHLPKAVAQLRGLSRP